MVAEKNTRVNSLHAKKFELTSYSQLDTSLHNLMIGLESEKKQSNEELQSLENLIYIA